MVVLPHPVRARRVWWREFISWRRVFKTSVILNFGEPFLYLVAFGFALGAYVNLGRGQTYAAFVAPALIAVTAMNAVTFDSLFGSWNNMHDKRVFEAIVTAPITPQDLVLGEFFWQASRALLYGTPSPALLWDAAYMVVVAVILAQAPLLVLPRRLQR